MTIIRPLNWEDEGKVGGVLSITEKKQTDLVSKAEELLVKPMEEKVLCDALNDYCIQELGEHYTSAQLKKVVTDLKEKLYPTPIPEVVEPEEEVVPEL